jgi:hypothetical protein
VSVNNRAKSTWLTALKVCIVDLAVLYGHDRHRTKMKRVSLVLQKRSYPTFLFSGGDMIKKFTRFFLCLCVFFLSCDDFLWQKWVPVLVVRHIQVSMSETRYKLKTKPAALLCVIPYTATSHILRLCRQHFPLKRQYTPTQLHDLTSQHRMDGGNNPPLWNLLPCLWVLISPTSDNGLPPSIVFRCRTMNPWRLPNNMECHYQRNSNKRAVPWDREIYWPPRKLTTFEKHPHHGVCYLTTQVPKYKGSQ